MQSISRRDLLRLLASGVAGYATLNLLGCRAPTPVADKALSVVPPGMPAEPPNSGAARPVQPVGTPHLAVVRGTDPAELTRRAVAALGGIERFVKPGQTVIVKPNICHAPRGVEYGTTTHPDVVGALVALAVAAARAPSRSWTHLLPARPRRPTTAQVLSMQSKPQAARWC